MRAPRAEDVILMRAQRAEDPLLVRRVSFSNTESPEDFVEHVVDVDGADQLFESCRRRAQVYSRDRRWY